MIQRTVNKLQSWDLDSGIWPRSLYCSQGAHRLIEETDMPCHASDLFSDKRALRKQRADFDIKYNQRSQERLIINDTFGVL